MSQGLEKSRNSCALQGAINVLSEVHRVVPIVHSTAGCTIQQALVNRVSSHSGFDIPSTNIIEKQVIFGGGSRLREEIKNTVKVVEGDLYVALSGCSSELVGDDVITMAKEAQEQGEPVIYFKAPGFKGKTHLGYEGVVNAIINQLPQVTKVNTEKDLKLVNIFGIIPGQDINWIGNLEELKRILEAIGLKANILFGFGQGIEQWKDVPSAALNLVFSKWGIAVGENLKKNYGIPFLTLKANPVGAHDTAKFISEVVEILDLDKEKAREFINNEKKKEEYYLNNIFSLYVDYNFYKTYGIVGDESIVNGISSFLTKTLGLSTGVKVFTDPIGEEAKEALENEKSEENVYYAEDFDEIEDILKANDIELILGSSLEKSISEALNIPLQVVSCPEVDNIILNRSYIGFNGAINILEDLTTVLLNHHRKSEEKLRKEINALII
ncbi:nitrogenase component 1 [Clostridium cellulovorans]|uniref:Oxidoreductase/nitrogenase component 1 n=1 Tax=Clostridium cellulovorans (strain ATCC 35296 / DSM 3052 / OCM 3 / 743B) TaxID=573061 RepID=D9SVW0_CLOC7|nr:nitrogenase component 1 [Clostridium cellulovorans]ADL53171.1 oxidoreductase/nitrogenase component 1 [Clostridium cellulovorans 743B]